MNIKLLANGRPADFHLEVSYEENLAHETALTLTDPKNEDVTFFKQLTAQDAAKKDIQWFDGIPEKATQQP